MTADEVPFDELSRAALDPEGAKVVALCEQAGIFRLKAESIIEDVMFAVERLDDLMRTARLDGPRRETARVRVLQHCRQVGIKDARPLIDAVLKQQKPAKASTKPAIVVVDDEAASTPANGEELLDQTAAIIRRHVVLEREEADLIALWIGAAHAAPWLDLLPMLLLWSPSPECGKTTAASVVGGLVPRALMVSNLTPAVLFRVVEAYHPTLIADECDTWLTDQHSEIRGIFNAGHWRAGAIVLRVEGDPPTVVPFNVFGPKVLAMIGKPPATMYSRCIAVKLQRKTPRDAIERVRESRVRETYASLRQLWRRWVTDHGEAIHQHDPALPAGLENRTGDNVRPLLTIAEIAGGAWPERARQAAACTIGGSGTSDDDSTNEQLLADVRTVFERRGEPYLSSAEIILELKTLDGRPWCDWNKGRGITPAQVAARLRDFGNGPLALKTRNTRIGDQEVGKRWHRVDFAAAWARYLGDPLHPLHANESGPKPANFEPLHDAPVAAPENALFSMNSGSVAVVAARGGELALETENSGEEDADVPIDGVF